MLSTALEKSPQPPFSKGGIFIADNFLIYYPFFLRQCKEIYSDADERRFSGSYQAQNFLRGYLHKSTARETKKAESFLTLPRSKFTPKQCKRCSPEITPSPPFPPPSRGRVRVGGKGTQVNSYGNFGDPILSNKGDAFMQIGKIFLQRLNIASPDDPYLFSRRTKYTLSLKICSGTSSLAQFMID